MNRLRHQDGQVTVMAAIFMLALVGMAGLVLDVGSWFRQQRVTQATVDAAALAGAQSLPNAGDADATATDFAGKNGGVAGVTITIGSKWLPNDMITVKQAKSSSGFFSNLFGVSTVTLRASASAVREVPSEARYVAPIVVNIKHPDLSGPGCPCFNDPTTLDLGKTGAPGSFALVNLDIDDTTGTIGASTLADWIEKGYDKYLPLGVYFSDPGAKWNNSTIQNAMQLRYGTDLLFPVYDTLIKEGSNAEYHILGWAGFHLTRAQAGGDTGSLDGYFTQVIWQGLVSTNGGPSPAIPDLGVHSVALVD
jgi:hypothetical protein